MGGAFVRLLVGIKKAQKNQEPIVFEPLKLIIDFAASTGLGLITGLLFKDIPFLHVKLRSDLGVAALAGFLGADLVDLWLKKEGVSIETPFQNPTFSDLTPRQQNAMAKVKTQGSITNDQHQKQHGISHTTAYRDLHALVQKGKLKRKGTGRGERYTF